MANKRLSILRYLASVGINLGKVSVFITMYSLVAAATFFLGAAYLMLHLTSPVALAYYTAIMLLVITIQIVQIIRRDQDRCLRDAFILDVQYFINFGRKRQP